MYIPIGDHDSYPQRSMTPNHYELEILRAFSSGDELEWSPWVGLGIFELKKNGYLTDTHTPKITEKGKAFLNAL